MWGGGSWWWREVEGDGETARWYGGGVVRESEAKKGERGSKHGRHPRARARVDEVRVVGPFAPTCCKRLVLGACSTCMVLVADASQH